MSEEITDRVAALIDKGQKVLASHRPNPPNVIGFPTLNTGLFNEWRAQAQSLLVQVAGSGHVYTDSFRKETENGPYQSAAHAGVGILKALQEDIRAGAFIGTLTEQPLGRDPLLLLDQICSRFHLVARQFLCGRGVKTVQRCRLQTSMTYRILSTLSYGFTLKIFGPKNGRQAMQASHRAWIFS